MGNNSFYKTAFTNSCCTHGRNFMSLEKKSKSIQRYILFEEQVCNYKNLKRGNESGVWSCSYCIKQGIGGGSKDVTSLVKSSSTGHQSETLVEVTPYGKFNQRLPIITTLSYHMKLHNPGNVYRYLQ